MELNSANQARKMIRTTMLKIRSNTPPSQQERNRAIATDIRFGSLKGKLVKRLVVHFHSSGCSWVRQAGGCTMCGFYAATSAGTPISSNEYQDQFSEVLSKHDLTKFPILALYNAGNILNETEMPFDALEKICIRISQNPHIKKVSIESKPEYINAEKLKKISAILQGKEIELGIGVETLNEKIKDLCINKPYPSTLFQQKVEMLLGIGIVPLTYLLLKPPFLTEREAIDDFLLSYSKLKQMGIHRIDGETMTVEEHTLVHLLWQKNLYRTPWLWSIIYILEQLKGKQIYFTPFRYIVDAVATARNCDRCSDAVKNSIFDYQEGKLTLEDLIKVDCTCKADWTNNLEQKDDRAIETRIIDTLSSIDV